MKVVLTILPQLQLRPAALLVFQCIVLPAVSCRTTTLSDIYVPMVQDGAKLKGCMRIQPSSFLQSNKTVFCLAVGRRD